LSFFIEIAPLHIRTAYERTGVLYSKPCIADTRFTELNSIDCIPVLNSNTAENSSQPSSLNKRKHLSRTASVALREFGRAMARREKSYFRLGAKARTKSK
jgi:hypothetical protein